MSIQTITSQIASIDREINNIERQIHSIEDNLSRKHKEATSILERIGREKDLKRIISFQKDLTRKNEEISRYEKDKSSKNKTLSEKIKKKHDLQQSLAKEEKREREKTLKEQKEILSIQHKIKREIEQQRILSLNSISVLNSNIEKKSFDVFISHASEDKEDFVRPLANLLTEKGLKVWYDDFELKVGVSLRRSIDNGIKNSKYGIVVLSEAFFKKEWTQKELDGLFAREVNGEEIILPIWHKISKNEVIKYSPMIADKVALNTTSFTIEDIAEKIADKINPSSKSEFEVEG